MDKKTILLTLKNIERIGNITAKNIMDSILNKDINLEKLYNIIQNTPKFKDIDFNTIKDAHSKAENMLNKLESTDIDMITYLDADYPKLFLNIKDHPIFLFYAGDIKIASEKCVAIVGTRNPSEKGKEIAYKLSSELSKEYVIVSGLAEGIDTQAHKAAVDNNKKTIAILGHGLDIIFPPSNKSLSKEIVSNGGLIISEYPLGQSYSKYTFVARDRLQSALSEKVFIIETKEDGGTMHTAKKAFEYNKEIFVFKSKSEDYILPNGNKILIEKGAEILDEDLKF